MTYLEFAGYLVLGAAIGFAANFVLGVLHAEYDRWRGRIG